MEKKTRNRGGRERGGEQGAEEEEGSSERGGDGSSVHKLLSSFPDSADAESLRIFQE